MNSSAFPGGTERRRPWRARRGAAAMVMVLAVTILASALLAQGLRRVLMSRRATSVQAELQQAEQLLQIGLRKAIELHSEGQLTNGEWELPAGTVHVKHAATIKVQVDSKQATVTARYPANVEHPVTVSEAIDLQTLKPMQE